MVISSIVFTIAYYAYRTVIVFQLNQNKLNIETEQYRTLNKLLENDLLDCDLAIQENETTIKYTSKKNGDISYCFGDYVTRSIDSVGIDTFFVRIIPPYISTQYVIPSDHIISDMEIYLTFHEHPIILHFQKEYASELIVNKKIEDQHNELH